MADTMDGRVQPDRKNGGRVGDIRITRDVMDWSGPCTLWRQFVALCLISASPNVVWEALGGNDGVGVGDLDKRQKRAM